ncbi:MAG: GDSL-type esterase/lipase family protein [Acidimicrobiia bacterium]
MIRRVIFRGALGAFAVISVELLYAILRRTPMQEEFDPSATFGHADSLPIRVAVLGDSTVTAPGVGGPDEIWISRICRRLADTHRVELKSFAIGGSMAHNLVAEQLEPGLEFEPDLVILSVGANDALKGITARVFEENLNRLVADFIAAGATVIQSGVGDLGTIPRLLPPLRHLLSRRALQFNAVHERVAERHGSWVVPQRESPMELWRDDRGMWSADLFHVSARGHEVWGDLGWKTVARALELSDA